MKHVTNETTNEASPLGNPSKDDTWHQATDLTIARAGALGDFVVTLPAFHALKSDGRRLHLIGNAPVARSLCDDLFASIASIDDPKLGWLFDSAPRSETRLSGAAIVLMHNSTIAESLAQRGADPIISAQPHPGSANSSSVAAHLFRATGRAHAASPLTKSIEQILSVREQSPDASTINGGALITIRIDPVLDRPRLLEAIPRWPKQSIGLDPPRPSTPIAIVHPGSGSPRKNWPIARFRTIAANLQDLGFQVLFLVGPADENVADQGMADLPNVMVARDLSLGALAELFSVAHLFVGNDSGTSHLAASIGTPTVTIFGPTRAARWAPLGPIVACIEPAQRCDLCRAAEARPVGCHCIDQITTDAVDFAIERLLSRQREMRSEGPIE